jgi:hypothetical protein
MKHHSATSQSVTQSETETPMDDEIRKRLDSQDDRIRVVEEHSFEHHQAIQKVLESLRATAAAVELLLSDKFRRTEEKA